MEGMKPISSWDMKLGRHIGSRKNVVSMMHKVGNNAMKEGQKNNTVIMNHSGLKTKQFSHFLIGTGMEVICYLVLYDWCFPSAIFTENLSVANKYKMRSVRILNMFEIRVEFYAKEALLKKIWWYKCIVHDLWPEIMEILITCSDLRDSRETREGDRKWQEHLWFSGYILFLSNI